jgi:hypothetical protein
MLTPVFLVARRYVQVDRLAGVPCVLADDDGLRIDQLRRLRHIANVDLSEQSGLVDADGHADIGGHGGSGDCDQGSTGLPLFGSNSTPVKSTTTF